MQVRPQRRLFLCLMEQASRKYVRSEWKGSLNEFLCLCFGFGPDTKFFRNWSQAEQALHTNIVELRPAKFTIFTFSRYKKDLVAHVQLENQAVLDYLEKMGGQETYSWFRKQRKYGNFVLLFLNTRVDKASRVTKSSSSEWILNKPMSMWICLHAGSATISKGT